jgi:TM2 domain-containing membrane protein YozV
VAVFIVEKSKLLRLVMEERKDPFNAGLLSLIIPGAGQMYCGQVGGGLILLVVTALGYIAYVIPGLILHIMVIKAAVSKARQTNDEIDRRIRIQREEKETKLLKIKLEEEQKKKYEWEQLQRSRENTIQKKDTNSLSNSNNHESLTQPNSISISCEEFVSSIEKLYGLYIKSVLSIHEYGDRKAKEIEKLRNSRISTEEIAFLDGLIPLMDKKILLHGDIQNIKDIVFAKATGK